MALLTGWPTDQADGSVSSEVRWRAMAKMWLASGVLRGAYTEFLPSYAASVITCQPGAVWLDGHYAELIAAVGTNVTADGLLVVRFTPADGKFELLFKSGVGQTPTQTTATWELPIASMAAGVMTDQRALITPSGQAPEAWREIGAVGQPPFTGGWVNFGGAFATAAFYKDAFSRVHLKGTIKSGTIAIGAFTLPVGYRPLQAMEFAVVSNAAFGVLDIAASGAVTPQGGNNASFFLGASFRAQQ